MDDVGHLLFGELATELLLPGFDGHVPLLRPLREPFEQLRLDALDLEGTGSLPCLVAELMQSLGQFVAIDRRAVVERAEHIAGLERLPSVLFAVPSGVEQDKMSVQLRVEGA